MYCQYFCTGMDFYMLEYNCAKKEGEVVNRIKELREKKKMSIDQLSKELKKKGVSISPASISKYEREERNPKIDKWIQLANFFGVSVSYLKGITQSRRGNLEHYQRATAMLNKANTPGVSPEDFRTLGEKAEQLIDKAGTDDFAILFDAMNRTSEWEFNREKDINSLSDRELSNIFNDVSAFYFLSLDAALGDEKAKKYHEKIEQVYSEYLDSVFRTDKKGKDVSDDDELPF